MRAQEFISEKWSKKYKSSINCDRPRGFSQKAHCAGRNKNEDYDPNATPPGPESKPTMPAGTVKVDVSDVYDWYKLGQHISNLKGLGQHDFGQGPPSAIMSFGSEDEEHKYIDALKKTGLDTTDIDPVDPKQPAGMRRQKTDPTYNVAEGARIARKAGQPANSKKHSDLYTDENPQGTITGLKFATVADARASVSKIRNSGRSHAHKIQAAVAMEQRARAAGKSEEAAVYRSYINANKKTDESIDLAEDLRDWFGKGKGGGAGGGGWDRYNTKGERIGKCGDRKPGEGKPKCLSKSRAASLRASGGKSAIATAVRRKRDQDQNPNRSGAAQNVASRVKKS